MKTPKPKNRAILSDEGLETKATDDTTVAPPMVRVRVVRQPLNEDGVHRAAGEVFETTAFRAGALGSLVEPAE